MRILLLNGPNLNLLGTREPERYGKESLSDIEARLVEISNSKGVEIECYQSNHEGEIIDKLHSSRGNFAGVVINAGGYTHTSVAIRDAISAIDIPVVEVHMTNIHAREEFRHTSLISGVVIGQVIGFGSKSYEFALLGLIDYISARRSN